MKRQLTEWENIFASHTSDKRFVSRVHKERLQLNNTMTNNPSKKWARDLSRQFSKEDIQMTHEHMKGCLTALANREMQINATMRCHFTCTKMARIKGQIISIDGYGEIGSRMF